MPRHRANISQSALRMFGPAPKSSGDCEREREPIVLGDKCVERDGSPFITSMNSQSSGNKLPRRESRIVGIIPAAIVRLGGGKSFAQSRNCSDSTGSPLQRSERSYGLPPLSTRALFRRQHKRRDIALNRLTRERCLPCIIFLDRRPFALSRPTL